MLRPQMKEGNNFGVARTWDSTDRWCRLEEGPFSANSLNGERLRQGAPLVGDIVDPRAHAARSRRIEQRRAGVATVESQAGTQRLGRPGDHDDLVPVTFRRELGQIPRLSLGGFGRWGETDDRDPRDAVLARRRVGGGDEQRRCVALRGQLQSLRHAGVGASQYDNGIGFPGGVGSRPDEQDGREHQEDDDHGDTDDEGALQRSALPSVHNGGKVADRLPGSQVSPWAWRLDEASQGHRYST